MAGNFPITATRDKAPRETTFDNVMTERLSLMGGKRFVLAIIGGRKERKESKDPKVQQLHNRKGGEYGKKTLEM